VEQEEGATFEVHSILHPVMVVMSPDCDLVWDFRLRFPDEEAARSYTPAQGIEGRSKHIPHVLLCDVQRRDEILTLSDMTPKRLEAIEKNSEARYHYLEGGHVRDPLAGSLPNLYLDFKTPLTLPTHLLYEGIRLYEVRRLAVVPPVYLHDLIQRFYGFLSRIALPD
jgi:hypothetical protein